MLFEPAHRLAQTNEVLKDERLEGEEGYSAGEGAALPVLASLVVLVMRMP